ncbi:MAG TPA: hypothetical protein VL974_09210 [Magnetospirillum sp.]|jgi:hypothetical protein|nr:hypothetical protein [Magnetospirillum sp.]
MRLVRFAALAPLAFLVACGGAPQRTGLASLGGGDRFGTDASHGGQTASLPGGEAEPSRLKGLSPTQVRAVLGKPMFTRRDAPAEIWQYRSRACTIDLFLYDEGGSQTVTHVAVRSQQPVNESQCMGELVGRTEGNPSS